MCSWRWEALLGLEMIRQYQIRLAQQRLVLRYFVLGNITTALVTHDGVKHCGKRVTSQHFPFALL